MYAQWFRPLVLGVLSAPLILGACSDGDDGAPGPPGPPGPPGNSTINASALSNDALALLDVESEVLSVDIASPPVVRFSLKTAGGIPITGIVPFWEDDDRYVRFTIAKLVPGEDGDPDSWVSYTRDEESGAPDYDTGSALVDNGDGTYDFTFKTDVTAVEGVTYEPDLTHRAAGQLGSGSVALEAQNFVQDFVPSGAAVTHTRDIAVMESCNECHDDLVFHGRRFRVEYCVNCHNPDLAEGEGDMAFMIHAIHAGKKFDVLDDGIDYSEVTYPQGLNNCRKCHNADDAATPDAGNWLTVPNLSACFGCHEPMGHPGGQPPATNIGCAECHPPMEVERYHISPNATPNNPMLLEGQRNITYELIEATVGEDDSVTVQFKILSDGEPLDVTDLPEDLTVPGSYPAFLLAWAQPQDGIDEPGDYNNMGNRGAQPNTISLSAFETMPGGVGTDTLSFDPATGVATATIVDPAVVFPADATLRAVGLQGYFEQELMVGQTTVEQALHTPSAVIAVTGDDERRMVVDSAKCGNCHEWFEGHGGNRTYNIQICTLCHTPNTSSSGRTVTNPALRDLDDAIQAALDAGTLDPSVVPDDPLTYPEDAQSLMALVHGIHASAARTRPFQFVRGPNRQTYYDWEEVTFPAETNNCTLCHDGDSYELPLAANLLPTTVRTTSTEDGTDMGKPVGDSMVELAFQQVPNETDWINTPTASSCFYCHTDQSAFAHMVQNGALLSEPSVPADGPWANRSEFGSTFESCTLCHGAGRIADVEEVHGF